MTEEGEISPYDVFIELNRVVAQRYNRVAEHSRLLEKAQLRLIHMMESGIIDKDVLNAEKIRIDNLKKEIAILREEAETADGFLSDFKKNKFPDM